MINGINSFRALAFLAVFFFHTQELNFGLSFGYTGVLAFFVLSGYLLTPILADMKERLDTKSYFLRFYGRRSLRIFPLYYFYIIIIAALSYIVMQQDGYAGINSVDRCLGQLPWTLTCTYNFLYASKYFEHTHLLTHFWSLAVEEQFYLVWPLVLWITPRTKLKLLLMLIIIGGPILRFGTALAVHMNIVPFMSSQIDLVIYALPFSHIDAFALGGFAALYGKGCSCFRTCCAVLLTIAVGFLTYSGGAQPID